MKSAKTCRANPKSRAARRARWPRAAPTRRASVEPSLGVVRLALIQPSIQNRSVRVDSAVAQEGPVAADLFDAARVAIRDQNFFAIAGSLGDHLAEGVGHKGRAPDLEPVLRR